MTATDWRHTNTPHANVTHCVIFTTHYALTISSSATKLTPADLCCGGLFTIGFSTFHPCSENADLSRLQTFKMLLLWEVQSWFRSWDIWRWTSLLAGLNDTEREQTTRESHWNIQISIRKESINSGKFFSLNDGLYNLWSQTTGIQGQKPSER